MKVYVVVNEGRGREDNYAGFSTTFNGAINIIKRYYIGRKYNTIDIQYNEKDELHPISYYYVSTTPDDAWLIFEYETDTPTAYFSGLWTLHSKVEA